MDQGVSPLYLEKERDLMLKEGDFHEWLLVKFASDSCITFIIHLSEKAPYFSRTKLTSMQSHV